MEETVTLSGDHANRVAQLLRIAQQEARMAQREASAHSYDALTELDDALSDQLAALAVAIEDDAADAEASGTMDRQRRAWQPLRAG
jgi:hypothetical protein